MKTEKENIRHGRGKSRRRRLIPAVQLAWLVALKSIGKDGNLVVVPEGSQPIVGTK